MSRSEIWTHICLQTWACKSAQCNFSFSLSWFQALQMKHSYWKPSTSASAACQKKTKNIYIHLECILENTKVRNIIAMKTPSFFCLGTSVPFPIFCIYVSYIFKLWMFHVILLVVHCNILTVLLPSVNMLCWWLYLSYFLLPAATQSLRTPLGH